MERRLEAVLLKERNGRLLSTEPARTRYMTSHNKDIPRNLVVAWKRDRRIRGRNRRNWIVAS